MGHTHPIIEAEMGCSHLLSTMETASARENESQLNYLRPPERPPPPDLPPPLERLPPPELPPPPDRPLVECPPLERLPPPELLVRLDLAILVGVR